MDDPWANSEYGRAARAPDSHIRTCRLCAAPLPSGALLCAKCNTLHGAARYRSWGKTILAALALPAVLAFIPLASDWLQTRKEERKELRTQALTIVDQFASSLEQLLATAELVARAEANFVVGCNSDIPDTSSAKCAEHYTAALVDLDVIVHRMGWKADALPLLSPDTYARWSALKDFYWQSCSDTQPMQDCGLRQRMVRLVYGINSDQPAGSALKTCRYSTQPPACKIAQEQLESLVTGPLNQATNLFFCSVVADINSERFATFQQRMEEAAASKVPSESVYKSLIERLKDNQEHSRCNQLLLANPVKAPQ